MDFDQTQAIQLSFEDETDDEDNRSSKTPVSYLKVFKYKDLPEKEYPLYEGENIIGRDESCNICIPTKALSKQHACIEVKGDSHLIYDKKSLNKTRRGKLFLQPDVRYELKHENKLIFADIECVYKLYIKAVNESGSETGSESMLNDVVSGNNNNKAKLSSPTINEEDYNDDSNASSDILQPTQCYEPTQQVLKASRSRVYAADSDDDSFISGNNTTRGNLTVKDTPISRKYLDKSDDHVLPESGSETDNEEIPRGILNAPTQACIMESETEEDEEDDVRSKDLLNAATQACATAVLESDEEEEVDELTVDLNAPTQACPGAADTTDDTDTEEGPSATVAYTMDAETSRKPKSGIGKLSPIPKSKNTKKKIPERTAATIPYTMEADISGVAETQSFIANDDDEELLIPNKKRQTLETPESASSDTPKTGNTDSPISKEDEVLEEEEDESEERDVSHLFAMPTLACDMDEPDDSEEAPLAADTTEDSTTDDGSTQPLDDGATQIVEEPVQKNSGDDDATQLVPNVGTCEDQKDDDATQPISENIPFSKGETTKKIKVTQVITETVQVAGNEDATLCVGETVPVGCEDQTQLIDGTAGFDPETKDKPETSSEEATQIYETDQTIPINDVKAGPGPDDATLAVGELDDTATIPIDNLKDEVGLEKATNRYGRASKRVPKKKGRGGKSSDINTVDATVPVEDLKQEEDVNLAEEPTQAYGASPQKSPKKLRDSFTSQISPLKLDCTDDGDGIDIDATQPYGKSPPKKLKSFQESADATQELSEASTVPLDEVIEDATQAYGDGSPVKSSGERGKFNKKIPEKEDSTEAADESESDGDTLPVEDIEFVADSESPEDDRPPMIPIPSRSPHKSALASPKKRSPSPSPKRVAFVGVTDQTPEDEDDDLMSPVIDRIVDSDTHSKNTPESTASRRGGRARGRKISPDKEKRPIEEVKSLPGRSRGRGRKGPTFVESPETSTPDEKISKNETIVGGAAVETGESPSPRKNLTEELTKAVGRSRRGKAVEKANASSEVELDVGKTDQDITGKQSTTMRRGKKSVVEAEETKKIDTNIVPEISETVAEIPQKKNTKRGRKSVQKAKLELSPEKSTESPETDDSAVGPKSGRISRRSVADKQKEINEESAESVGKVQQKPPTRRGRQSLVEKRTSSALLKKNEKIPAASESAAEVPEAQTSRRGGRSVLPTEKQPEEVEESSSTKRLEDLPTESVTEVPSHGKRGRKSVAGKSNESKTVNVSEANKTAQTSRRGGRSVLPTEKQPEEVEESSSTKRLEDLPTESVTEVPSHGKRGRKSVAGKSNESKTVNVSEANKTAPKVPQKQVYKRGRKSVVDKTPITHEVSETSASSLPGSDFPKGEESTKDKSQESETTGPIVSGRRGRQSSGRDQTVGEAQATQPSRGRKRRGQDDEDQITELSISAKKISKIENTELTSSQESATSSPKPTNRRGRKTSLEDVIESPTSRNSRKTSPQESGDTPATNRWGRQSSGKTKDVDNNTDLTSNQTPKAKKRRGQGDESQERELSASASKISKRGDGGGLTPSRIRSDLDETISSPTLRKKEPKPRVMFTGVVDEQGEKTVKELGGTLADSIQECSHLVTDKIRRTVKFLGGLCLGVQIVSPQWLEQCKTAGMFLDSSKYIVSDKTTEKQYKFLLHQSLDIASTHPMLQGYKIHVTKSVKPGPDTMKEILECAGAEYIKTLPKKKEGNIIVISCDEDKKLCQPAVTAGIDVVSSEFILTGVLRQTVEIESFRLFTTPTTAAATNSKTAPRSKARKR
ncbi:mediator of DNA damage checkpoint protein 1 [Patella vulgata]|uniref:mediator of DNA damage checkpoint protein 1 n=1 Tax=Patella vulgata TaxID=6465 RepID=UPI00217FF3B1|nr:mediator of DNA damage checkpoint protein 1 [Patella vulgata]